jgi:hypothetical protein
LSVEPLSITYSSAGCVAGWQTEASVSIAGVFVTGQDVIPAKILATAVDTPQEYSPDAVDTPTFPRCGFSAEYSTVIPGATPDDPGETYTFTGPSLTSTLVLQP